MADEKLICVIGDQEQVTGFLLAGVGQTDSRGSNFLVVDAKTAREAVEATFKSFGGRDDVGLILISAPLADAIRPVITAHQAAHKIPMVIEIPSKDGPADAGSNDPIMKRILQLLGET